MSDKAGLFRVQHPRTLIASSRATIEQLQRIPDGQLVNGKLFRSRNPKFNSLAHAVFAKIATAKGVSIETVKMYLKAATGHVDLIRMPDGQLAMHGRPMDFGAMGEEEFRAFWDEALIYIFEEILPGLPHNVRNEIENMVIRPGLAGRNL